MLELIINRKKDKIDIELINNVNYKTVKSNININININIYRYVCISI